MAPGENSDVRMTHALRLVVSRVRFNRSSDHDTATGLLGWVSLVLNGRLRLDGVALRRTHGGGLRLSFPERRDSAGRRHSLVRPLDAQARADIEAQVLAALETEGVRA